MKTGIAVVSIGVALSIFTVWFIIEHNPSCWWLAVLFILVVILSVWITLYPKK